MGVIGGWRGKQLRGDELIKNRTRTDKTYCSTTISTVQTEALLVILCSHSAAVIPAYCRGPCGASVTTGVHMHNAVPRCDIIFHLQFYRL